MGRAPGAGLSFAEGLGVGDRSQGDPGGPCKTRLCGSLLGYHSEGSGQAGLMLGGLGRRGGRDQNSSQSLQIPISEIVPFSPNTQNKVIA